MRYILLLGIGLFVGIIAPEYGDLAIVERLADVLSAPVDIIGKDVLSIPQGGS